MSKSAEKLKGQIKALTKQLNAAYKTQRITAKAHSAADQLVTKLEDKIAGLDEMLEGLE